MPPKNVLFTRPIEERICHEVEVRPILWDCTLEVYRRADLKPSVWDEIACILGPGFTGEMVSKRFKNMKETYAKNHSKEREMKQRSSGNGTEDKFVPTWYLYKLLSFLSKSVMQAESASNLQHPKSPENGSENCHSAVFLNGTFEEAVKMYYDENLKQFFPIPEDSCPTSPSPSARPLVRDRFSESSDSCQGTGSYEELNQISGNSSCGDTPPPSRPSSTPLSGSQKRSHSEVDHVFFNKRGAGKSAALASAVKMVKDVMNAPIPPPPPPQQQQPLDDAAIFGQFIAARLRRTAPENRKAMEDEVMAVVMKF